MERIRVKYLREGMKVIEDVLNDQGAVVIGKGQVLSRYDIERLTSNSGVEFVSVENSCFLDILREEAKSVSQEVREEVNEIFSVYNPVGEDATGFEEGIRLLALKFRAILSEHKGENK